MSVVRFCFILYMQQIKISQSLSFFSFTLNAAHTINLSVCHWASSAVFTLNGAAAHTSQSISLCASSFSCTWYATNWSQVSEWSSSVCVYFDEVRSASDLLQFVYFDEVRSASEILQFVYFDEVGQWEWFVSLFLLWWGRSVSVIRQFVFTLMRSVSEWFFSLFTLMRSGQWAILQFVYFDQVSEMKFV